MKKRCSLPLFLLRIQRSEIIFLRLSLLLRLNGQSQNRLLVLQHGTSCAHFILSQRQLAAMGREPLPVFNKRRSMLCLLRAMKLRKGDIKQARTSSDSSDQRGAMHVVICVRSRDASYWGVRGVVEHAIPTMIHLLIQMRHNGLLKTTRVSQCTRLQRRSRSKNRDARWPATSLRR